MIEWNKCIYEDCMNLINGLPTLEDKSIDLCLTDIPFGIEINSKGNIKGGSNIRKGTIKYSDKREDWLILMKKAFIELRRICNGVIIYCGSINLSFFCKLEEPRQIIYRHASNCFSNGSLSYRITIFPLVCYGKFNKRIGNDLFKYPSMSGWMSKEKWIHPCPLNKSFWTDLIFQLKPTSILDPFLGSGITAEVCTKLGIPWLGYEINEVYSQDIDKRLKGCKKEPMQVNMNKFLEVY